MSLAAFQTALASVLTDASLLERLQTCSVGDEPFAQLNAGELDELKRLAEEHLKSAARALLQKRLGYVRKLLPFTADELGSPFDEAFLRFAAQRAVEKDRPLDREAAAFAGALLQTAAVQDQMVGKEWLRDLIWVEQAACLYRSRRLLLICRRLSYDIRHWMRRRKELDEPLRKSNWLIVIRVY
ncbi:MAG: hypothetical protein U0892_22195 [Pirellulales bacterium]